MWLWHTFLRSGDPDAFQQIRYAEAVRADDSVIERLPGKVGISPSEALIVRL